MAIITLTSDFGTKDYDVAAMKGLIYKELDQVNIVDISHQISPFNVFESAYIVKNAVKDFPKGCINIVAVDSEYSPKNQLLIAKFKDQYYLSADNGVFSFILEDLSQAEIYQINYREDENLSSTKKLVLCACHLARGGKAELIAKKITSIRELTDMQPSIVDNGNRVSGSIIYIDNYGNVVSNITASLFKLAKGNRQNFEIVVRNTKITEIYRSYSEIENKSNLSLDFKAGRVLALFNSNDFLEIAVYRSNLNTVGGASSLLGLEYRDNIHIIFKD